MKIRIEMTFEVDERAWKSTYGLETAAQVREDVKAYVRNQVNGSPAADECGLRTVR